MTRSPIVLAGLLLASPAAGDDPAPDAPPVVSLAPGEAVDVCRLARCPVSGVFCDDPSLVRVVHEGGTVRLRAEKAGGTLCGIQQSDTTRRVVKVVVAPPKAK